MARKDLSKIGVPFQEVWPNIPFSSTHVFGYTSFGAFSELIRRDWHMMRSSISALSPVHMSPLQPYAPSKEHDFTR